MEVFTNCFYKKKKKKKKKKSYSNYFSWNIALMNCFQDIQLVFSLKTYSLGIKLKEKLAVFLSLDAITRILTCFLHLTIT